MRKYDDKRHKNNNEYADLFVMKPVLTQQQLLNLQHQSLKRNFMSQISHFPDFHRKVFKTM